MSLVLGKSEDCGFHFKIANRLPPFPGFDFFGSCSMLEGLDPGANDPNEEFDAPFPLPYDNEFFITHSCILHITLLLFEL